MRSLKILGRFLTVGACMLAITLMTSESAFARAQYLKAFKAKYGEKELKGVKVTCGVCHPTKSKKERNNYGAALGKLVGKKNEKDAKKIEEAIGKAEKEKSATDGKTFGDLIKDGKLPGTEDVVK